MKKQGTFSLRRILGVVPALFVGVLLIPQSYAGPIADAVEQTLNSSSFSYDADASIMFGKGGVSDMPFEFDVQIEEQGGKNQGEYLQEGSIMAKLSNFDDLPRNMNDLTMIDMMMDYKGSYNSLTKVSLAHIGKMTFSADARLLDDVMGMINQLAKFMTGRTFRVSQNELIESLSAMVDNNSPLPSEEEIILQTLAGSEMSIEEISVALAQFVDDMVESGFMEMQVETGSQRRFRTGIVGGTNYVITPGTSVTAEGAVIFREGLVTILSKLMPGVGQLIAGEIASVPAERMAADLTEALVELQGADIRFEVTVSNGVVQGADFLVDLSALNVPLRISETVDVNYSTTFTTSIPQDDANMIDLNQIIEGFVAIGELTTSSYQSNYGYSQSVTSPEVSADSLVQSDISYINSICGGDAACIRREVLQVKRTLRGWVRDGYLSREEYRKALRDLNTMLR